MHELFKFETASLLQRSLLRDFKNFLANFWANYKNFKTLWSLLMGKVQLSQGGRATTRRQFT